MADKKEDKGEAKLTLFNHSRNPYNLGKTADGTVRWFKIGESIKCKTQAEYDMLKNYKGITTAKQTAPGLHARVLDLETQVSAKNEQIDRLEAQLEKFQEKGGKGK